MKEGIKVCSLTRNTLGVRGTWWNFGMGTKMNDKWVNYSYGPTHTKQWLGKCTVGALSVHGQAIGIHKLTRLTIAHT
jgi:hypothetical protein